MAQLHISLDFSCKVPWVLLYDRLFVPILAAGLAAKAEIGGFGLLNLIDLPGWLEIVFAIIVLDLLIYLQHLAVQQYLTLKHVA